MVQRGYLGVEVQPVGPDMAEALGLKSANGALIDKTMPRTPAADAGLNPADIITKVNGQEVKDAADLTREIGQMKPGERVELSYLRDGAEKTVSATLAHQKPETARAESQDRETPTLGL